MKKLCTGLCVLLGLTFFLGGCADTGAEKSAVVSGELIAVAANAQYLPSRDLLVKNESAAGVRALAYSPTVGDATPAMLLNDGLSEEEYEALIEAISPIDTPFDREFTVPDARNEVVDILSAGVLFDEWFGYQEGDYTGYGKFFVTDKDGVLSITRLSSFLPWIYDSETGEYLDNDDFSEEKPNYPIRSDNYLRIRIYKEGDKEVVECEVAENLSYYDEVTPVSYQFMRNVKDTSFTKLQITARSSIPDLSESGGWGYDIDTDLPYGYQRNFMQLTYSNPDDIQWLSATQQLPYAFDLTAENHVQFGSRSAQGGFYDSLDVIYNTGEFSFVPSEAYKTIQTENPIAVSAAAQLENVSGIFNKNYHSNGDSENFYCNADLFTPEAQTLLEEQITSMVEALTSIAETVSVPDATWAPLIADARFDCTAENTDFEELFAPCFDAVAIAAIDNSELAKAYLNNELYELSETPILPVQ